MYLNADYLLCMIPAILLTGLASLYVKSSYRTWGRFAARSGVNGYEAAQRLIARGGLHGIQIQGISGTLTDHYDPRTKTLRLSQGVAESPSVASLAVAAHELGHAQQDAQGYLPLRFRGALVPLVNIGSSLGWILIAAGLMLNLLDLAWIGVAFFAGGAVFALATLPVEFNASARARRMLAETGIVTGPEEQRGVNTVLRAAALTYVAALVTAIMQLFYFIGMVGGRRRR